MTDPKDIKWNFCLLIGDCPYNISFADTGVPHVVHFAKDIDTLDVKRLGESIRYHKEFSPVGANVNFVQVIDSHTIKVRTYERGVEDETLACGTGVVASAIIAAESEKLSSPISVKTRSGETLKVYFKSEGGTFANVFLEGRAKLVFTGKITL
jgi:diaminopimelate epimerase